MFKDVQSFYKSKEWLTFREILISKRLNERGEIICEHCGKPIYKKYDCIVHHKIELTDANVNDLNISLNPDNCMLIHFDCHNEIHSRFGSDKQEVYIVYGSPCSGKSAWVNSVVKRNDIVADMNDLYKAINPTNNLYDKPERLYKVVKSLYDKMLDDIFMRYGYWQNAYIITTECLPTQLNRMAEKYNAKLIHIDTDKKTCVSNLMKDKERSLYKEKWMKFIYQYWEKYTAPGNVKN
jgi:hypothetical protein